MGRILRKPELKTEAVRYAKIGEDVILNCHVQSLSEGTKITWTKNNNPVSRENMKHRIIHNAGHYHFTSDLIIYNVEETDFTNYGCFASNEVGTDYKVFPLMVEEETDYLTIIITTNTIIGVIILALIIVYHKKKKRKPEHSELPRFQKEVLPPIYKGKDPSVFNELLLDKGMHEEYLEMTKEYFDNVKNNEKVKELRIVNKFTITYYLVNEQNVYSLVLYHTNHTSKGGLSRKKENKKDVNSIFTIFQCIHSFMH